MRVVKNDQIAICPTEKLIPHYPLIFKHKTSQIGTNIYLPVAPLETNEHSAALRVKHFSSGYQYNKLNKNSIYII